ncbi:MAG: DUF1566 domain-containing protein [Thermodesulfobacteriota bacterium]
MSDYSRSVMKWEKYLQVNTLAGDIGKSLKHHSNSINSSISNASQEIIDSNIASQEEINRVLQHGFDDVVDSIDMVGDAVESLHADFNFAMGEVLWKLELVQGTLTGILQEIRLAEFEREARSFRIRAEDAYKSGWYKESLSDFLEAEKRNYQDFAVLFSIANIYLYHGTECEDDYKEPSLEKALAYYLKSAKYSTPKAKKHAAKSYLFSGWICYLLEKDNEALEYTSNVIDLNPDLAEAYFQKAKILMCIDDPDKALSPLRKAIEIDRNYSIKARLDEDFKRCEKAVLGLLDKMRTEAQRVAQEALDSVNTRVEKINSLGIGRYNLQDYARDEREIIASEIAKATHSFSSGTLYGYLDSEAFSAKASAALSPAVMVFIKEAVADVENRLEYLEKELSVSQSGMFGKSAELEKLESEELELQENILELESLGVDGKLNSVYRILSVSQVLSIPNIKIRKSVDNGFAGYSTIKHKYEMHSINGDKVVMDRTTGLMWHQSGYNCVMKWNEAKDWVESLNNRGYAGYHDWRLPTVEEAASLLKSSRKSIILYNLPYYDKDDLYIDPLFSEEIELPRINRDTWTSNKHISEGAWYVEFYGDITSHSLWRGSDKNTGSVQWGSIYNLHHVRPVCSMK